MRLAIRHISRFKFDDNAAYALQRLRLRPQSGPGQTVRAWQVTIGGVEPTLGYADGLGNHVDLVRHERDRNEIVIVAGGVVETQDRAGVIGQPEDYAPPWIFERATDLTRSGAAIKALVAARPAGCPTLDTLHWLMGAVHAAALACSPAGEAVDAHAALAGKSGSSRDFAQVFVAASRALKVPARYVSGYLLADVPVQRRVEALQQIGGAEQQQEAGAQSPGMARQNASAQTKPVAAAAQPQSGHAWAEAFVEGLGWVGFDPLMNRCPDERYVRLATGFDSRDTVAVHGLGAKQVDVEISVMPSPELV